MSTKVQARHFHAGKLRKEIDGVEFPGLKEGARVTGANRCSISQVLHGFLKTAGGYKWEALHE